MNIPNGPSGPQGPRSGDKDERNVPTTSRRRYTGPRDKALQAFARDIADVVSDDDVVRERMRVRKAVAALPYRRDEWGNQTLLYADVLKVVEDEQ